MNEQRVKRYLRIWSDWQLNDKAEIQRKLGVKLSKLVQSGAGHDFDQLADGQEHKDALSVESIINDEAYITPQEKSAIHAIHLASRWQYMELSVLRVYENALESLERGLNAKGLA